VARHEIVAYSFHLYWDLASPAREVSVTLEVIEPPSVDRLYFWALQSSFLTWSGSLGAGHLGLQWNPRYPDRKAVNWGGYDTGGTVLSGSGSPLPSRPGDPNTRDFPWLPERRYKLRIFPSPEVGWRGEVTDLDSGVPTMIRDLEVGGDHLGHVVVWSELFCECSDPRSVVAWSEPTAIGRDGEVRAPRGLRVNYKADGCPNTDVYTDGNRVCQATASERTTPQGSVLAL
jgi:hypothetical protein